MKFSLWAEFDSRSGQLMLLALLVMAWSFYVGTLFGTNASFMFPRSISPTLLLLPVKMVSGNAKLLKAYHKRKAGLFKKVRELGTLCDVKVCVIAYGPNSTVPETWPVDPSAVVQLIREYKYNTNKRSASEKELPNSKKKKILPPSAKGLDGCSPELLRQMMVELDERIGEARSWMQILKGGGEEEETLSHVLMNPQPMLVSYVLAAAPKPTMSGWLQANVDVGRGRPSH